MSRIRTIQNGRTIALAMIVAGAGLACATTTAAPASRRTDSPSVQVVDVDGSIANARAAQRQHDWQAIRRFQAQIIERVGLPAVSGARLNYQRAVADLAAATARGDSHSRAGFRAELQALCEPGGLVGAFESCDGDVIVWGG